jgi:prepilin-type N-terminal cleavage/methylation domain-containing protein
MTDVAGARLRRHRHPEADDGFGMIELMVAFAIFSIAVLGLASVALGSLRSLAISKERQTAVTLATRAIESARYLSYDGLFMDSTGLAPGATFDPDGAGPMPPELLAQRPGGAIAPDTSPYRFTEGSLTVRTRVTWVCSAPQTPGGACQPSDPNAQNVDTNQWSKRVTVVVSSTVAPTMEVRQSTIVSLADRGLPSPEFSVFPSLGDSATPPNKNEVCFSHAVNNTGSNDSYEIDFPTTAGFTYRAYEDKGVRGLRDAPHDTLLFDVTGSGAPNTRTVITGASLDLLVCYQSQSTPADGATFTFETKVRSAYDGSVSRSLTHKLVFSSTLRLYLSHLDDEVDGGVPARGGTFDLKLQQPVRTTLIDYDTDSRVGKRVEQKSNDITNSGNMEWAVRFERKFSRPTTLTLPATLQIWTSSREATDRFNSGSGSSSKGLVMNYRIRRISEDGTAVLQDTGATNTSWRKDAYTHSYTWGTTPLFVPRSVEIGASGTWTFQPGERLRLILHCDNSDWKPTGFEFKADDHCVYVYDTTAYPAYLQVGLQ